MAEENLNISVENYGPISRAQGVELRPLTVLVGPSNTGKSYLAVLVHAVTKSMGGGEILKKMKVFDGTQKSNKAMDRVENKVERWLKSLTENENETNNIKFSDIPELIRSFIADDLAFSFHKTVYAEINRNMGISDDAKGNGVFGGGFRLRAEGRRKKITIKKTERASRLEVKNISILEATGGVTRWESPQFPNFDDTLMNKYFVLKNFALCVLQRVFPNSGQSFYLPASRTGILQGRAAITGALVKGAAYPKPASAPTLSGIVADFLHEIIVMDFEKIPDKKMAGVAEQIESDVLQGKVHHIKRSADSDSQIVYQKDGKEIPLMRSSSMVSEIAPLVLFLKHCVRKGDFLVIEEPEAHLHPDAQKSMATGIVRLVRAGVRVLVTTHSDYFLEQISNYVASSKLKKKSPLSLDESKVAVYSFAKQDKKGTVVEKQPFDIESGYTTKDHDAASSGLYDETVEILDKYYKENR